MFKTFIAWPVGRLIAGWLLATTVRLIKATMRWRVLHEARRDAILAYPGPVILAFWHNLGFQRQRRGQRSARFDTGWQGR